MVSAARRAFQFWCLLAVGLTLLLGPIVFWMGSERPVFPWMGYDLAPVVMWSGVVVVATAIGLATKWGEQQELRDEGSSEVVGVMLLVGFVAVAASGAFLTAPGGQSVATDADVRFLALENRSAPGEGMERVDRMELEVERIHGGDRGDARVVVGDGSIPWMIEKGSRAVVGCPPEGVPIGVVIGEELVAWSNALPCHVDAAEPQVESEDGGDVQERDGYEECPLVSIELVASRGYSVQESSATFEVEVCTGDLV